MLLIPCPHCGPRSHIEFTYAGDATVRRPADDAPLSAWVDYVYVRDNPHGPHREYWHHAQGCRAYVTIERDTSTYAIVRTQSTGDGAP